MRDDKRPHKAMTLTLEYACARLDLYVAPPISVIVNRGGRYFLSWARYQGRSRPGSELLWVSKPEDAGETLRSVRSAIERTFPANLASRLVLLDEEIGHLKRRCVVLDLDTLEPRALAGRAVWTEYATGPIAETADEAA